MMGDIDVDAASSAATEGYSSSDDPTQEGATASNTQEGATDLDGSVGPQPGQGVPYSRFREVNQGFQNLKKQWASVENGTHPKFQEARQSGWDEYDKTITSRLQQNPELFKQVQDFLRGSQGTQAQFGKDDIEKMAEAKVNEILSNRDRTAAERAAQTELHQSINTEIDKIGIGEPLTRNMMTVGIAELINADAKTGKYKSIGEYARMIHAALQRDSAKIAQWSPPMSVAEPGRGQPALTPEEQQEAIKRTVYAQHGIGRSR